MKVKEIDIKKDIYQGRGKLRNVPCVINKDTIGKHVQTRQIRYNYSLYCSKVEDIFYIVVHFRYLINRL